MFLRKGAKNTRCQNCRDAIKLGSRPSNKYEILPQLDRDIELAMQEEWLKNNNAKVG